MEEWDDRQLEEQVKREIRREQVTGGVIAVFVAGFEIGVKLLADKYLENRVWSWVLLLAVLVLIFLVVFWVLGILLTRFKRQDTERMEEFMRQDLPIRGVGSVSGYWIDAIWQNAEAAEPFQSSVIHITSSRATGFEIHGDTYSCHYENGRARIDGYAGHFHGSARHAEDSRLVFMAKGGEAGEPDEGVTTYNFRHEVGSASAGSESQKLFDGDFPGKPGRRYVFGQKLKDDEIAKLSTEATRNFLLEQFLSRSTVRDYRKKRTSEARAEERTP